jgi:hypothetical protein
MKIEEPSNHSPAFPDDLTYDEAGRGASRTEYHPVSAEPRSVRHYEYDEHDRIVRMTQTCFGSPGPAPAPRMEIMEPPSIAYRAPLPVSAM